MTTVVNIDYVLLAILLFLTLFACCYCVYRVIVLSRTGQIELLLRPTRVLFSHRNEGDSTEQLRTVVAYQNPFTGDYCVRKGRAPHGYVNRLASPAPASPDSGLSDEYEPLHLDPDVPPVHIPHGIFADDPRPTHIVMQQLGKHDVSPTYGDNSVNKSWNWNYKEYQI